MAKILTLLNSGTKVQSQRNPVPHYRIEISAMPCLEILTQYLKTYSFRGQRRVMFKRWQRLMYIRKYPVAVTPKSEAKLCRLMNHLNAERGKPELYVTPYKLNPRKRVKPSER